MNSRAKKGIPAVLILVVNIVLLTAIFIMFFVYMQAYNNKIYEQNLGDIRNVNQASAQIAMELSASHGRRLENLRKYLTKHLLSSQQLMEYVADTNAEDDVNFQIIGSDYTGYVLQQDADGNFPSVSYQARDYLNIRQIIDAADTSITDVPITVEFTDPYTGSRSFGRYIYVKAQENGKEKTYTLLAIFKSASFSEHISLDGGFDGMATVLINEDGSYALHNAEFKSDNFFQYLYVFNDLSLDQLEKIEDTMLSNDKGTFTLLNSAGENCVYIYKHIPEIGRYCVSCVPLSSFHNSNPDFRFTAVLSLLLLAMMTLDLLYLYGLNKQLKVSAIAAETANEAKTDFLSRMSHDIRTPINVISGMTELALMEKNSERTDEYLKNIQSSGKFLLGLVNDILDMNKVESGNMELHPKPYSRRDFDTYVNAVIRPLCEEKNIDFTIGGNIEDCVLMLDPLRMNQVFFNLLSNAVKFTPKDGHIKLIGNSERLADGKIALDIAVSDDGVGMSQEFQDSMFSPFAQEERTLVQNSSGTGLGLAIVKRLIDLMGGTIRVESAIGKGTTFYVHLVAETAVLPEGDNAQTVLTGNLVGKRILLCEDHPLNAKIIDRMLELRSIAVEIAENGKIGVDKFSASKENYYDAILMDMRMPIMDGLEATRAIRALPRADAKIVPIIALTANAYDTDVANCLAAGMNDHLAKPVDTDKLCETLLQLISECSAKKK